MQIKIQPMGMTQTNCYIVTIDNKDIIIDPGMGATEWIVNNVTNPIAILNTHGHYDHVWSNASVKESLKVPIYCPKDDVFMLTKCPLGQNVPPSVADVEVVEEEEVFNIQDVSVKFRHFAGHTLGCSVIEIKDVWFSGDFLFQQSIGRWDFPFSSAKDMLKSLKKAQKIEEDFTIYPGHGLSTTLKKEQQIMDYWINQVKSTI